MGGATELYSSTREAEMCPYEPPNNGQTNSPPGSTYSSNCGPEAVGQLSERAEILLEALEL